MKFKCPHKLQIIKGSDGSIYTPTEFKDKFFKNRSKGYVHYKFKENYDKIIVENVEYVLSIATGDDLKYALNTAQKRLTNGIRNYTKERNLNHNKNTKSTKKENEEDRVYDFVKQVYELSGTEYHFVPNVHSDSKRYAVALFSDAHIEENVDPNTVLGYNEYNVSIAEDRIGNYFCNLVECLIKDEVDHLIFGCLGDIISGYIHDELAQTNNLTPIEAIDKAESLLFSGLKYICDYAKTVKTIQFVGICGNHSRTTKKIQHANGPTTSYEYLMYKHLEDMCNKSGLNIEFIINKSEVTPLITPDNKKFLFCHGHQIKGSGNNTVCGIYPALNRLFLKWKQTFNQDKIYLGHFHSCVSIPNCMVNGSIIGYTAFSMSNGFPCEEPAQMYQVFDSEIGELLTRKIYCK